MESFCDFLIVLFPVVHKKVYYFFESCGIMVKIMRKETE